MLYCCILLTVLAVLEVPTAFSVVIVTTVPTVATVLYYIVPYPPNAEISLLPSGKPQSLET